LSVGWPGCHPAGVASAPLLARTTWNARNWRTVSANMRPTGGVSTSIAWITPSGSMMNRPRNSMPMLSS
jgi:hypothetical protein